MSTDTWVLVLKPVRDPLYPHSCPRERPAVYRMKMLLKAILRVYGFRCTRIDSPDAARTPPAPNNA